MMTPSCLCVLFLATTTVLASAQDPTCPNLSQADAPLYRLESSYLPVDLLVEFLTNVPLPISQCLASFDSSTLTSALNVIDASCVNVPGSFENLAEIKDLKDLLVFDFMDVLKSLKPVFEFMYNAQDSSYINLCTAIRDPLTPCVRKSLPKLLAFLTTRTGQVSACCQGLEPYMEQTFGSASMADGLIHTYELLVNAVCSYRSPGFETNVASQTCGFTFFHSFTDSVNLNEVVNFRRLLEIPDHEACAAYTGSGYNDTRGRLLSAINPNPKKYLDSCSQYLDAIVTSFARIPVLSQVTFAKNTSTLKDIVTKDMCVDWNVMVDSIMEFVLDHVPVDFKDYVQTFFVGQESTIKLIRTLFSCLHVPSGFTNDCAFSTKATTFMESIFAPDQKNVVDDVKEKKNAVSENSVNMNGPVISTMLLLMTFAAMLF